MKTKLFGLALFIFLSYGCESDLPVNQVNESNTRIEKEVLDKGIQKTRVSYLGIEYLVQDGENTETGFLIKDKRHGVIRYFTRQELNKVQLYQDGKFSLALETENFDFDTTKVSGIGCITFPKNWQKGFQNGSYFVREVIPDHDYVPNLVYSADKPGKNITLSSYYKAVLDKFENSYKDFSIGTSYEIEHNGLKGVQFKYECTAYNKSLVGLGTLLKVENNFFIFINGTIHPKTKQELLDFMNSVQLMVDKFSPATEG